MKRKLSLILIIILMLFLIAACTESNTSNSSSQHTTQLVGDEAVDMGNFDPVDVHNVTSEDLEEKVTGIVNEYVEENDNLSISVIRVMEAKLAVDHHSQVKKFNNMNVNMDFRIDLEGARIDNGNDFTDYADNIGKEIKVALGNGIPLEFSRVETLSFAFADYSREHSYDISYLQTREPETLVAFRNEESETEKIALKKTFEVIGEDRKFYGLIGFGIKDNILWIDFVDGIVRGQPSQSIEELSESLSNLVLSDEELQEYIDDRADTLMVTFNETHFEYELN